MDKIGIVYTKEEGRKSRYSKLLRIIPINAHKYNELDEEGFAACYTYKIITSRTESQASTIIVQSLCGNLSLKTDDGYIIKGERKKNISGDGNIIYTYNFDCSEYVLSKPRVKGPRPIQFLRFENPKCSLGPACHLPCIVLKYIPTPNILYDIPLCFTCTEEWPLPLICPGCMFSKMSIDYIIS